MHADTDQEHSDHTLRLGWFGAPDPRPLDVDFFSHPPASYAGVQSHVRQSSSEFVFSMGERWPRAADGSVINEEYGAMDRTATAAATAPPPAAAPAAEVAEAAEAAAAASLTTPAAD